MIEKTLSGLKYVYPYWKVVFIEAGIIISACLLTYGLYIFIK